MSRTFYLLGILVIFFLCNNCQKSMEQPTTHFKLHPAEATGVHFSNTLFETTQLNIINFEYFYNGAGVAIGDINQDGLQDIYFSGNMVDGKLYLNRGNFHFEDITAKSGISTKNQWGTGVNMVDLNGDGLLDLYLCFAGPYGPERRRNMLYINNGDATFTEKAAEYGLDDDAHTTQAAFFDYDRDGDLDAYLVNNITDETGPNIIRPKRVHGEMANTDRLYRNDNGHFTNVSAAAGMLIEGYGLGVAIGDINQDGWPDIYVSNDYLSNDLLYINHQDGSFTDQAANYFRHTSYSSMGCDMADCNNDGLLDIVAVDMLPPDNQRRKMMLGSANYNRFRSEIRSGYSPQFMRNSLQLNCGTAPDGQPVFSEIGQMAGVDATDWSWSPLLQDLDNDGLKDLVITNGYPRDITNLDFAAYKADLLMNKQYNDAVLMKLIKAVNEIDGAYLPNFVFQNQGKAQFKDQSAAWGFAQPSFSHGAAVADLDNDGDLDYVANNSFDKVFIYENEANKLNANHFLRLKIEGQAPNTGGIGAKIWAYHDSIFQYHEHYLARGFQSSMEPIVHFGLGKTEAVDSVLVQWPDGKWQVLRNLKADEVLTVKYEPQPYPGLKQVAQQPIFEQMPAEKTATFLHKDPYYNDFGVQPLLPHKHSQDGPNISTGDLNGDGLGDFFIGGAFRQSGQVFLQNAAGGFTGRSLDATNKTEEDLSSVFFDADGDSDLDLYVTSGSSEFPPSSAYYQDRLYRNDGKGNFAIDKAALPEMHTSTACVAAGDYDRDGDLDLFVGGRMSPGRYPAAPPSFLLENQKGRFVDVTVQKAKDLQRYGMVSAAQWADLDKDGYPELVLAGEWLPISIFKNMKGQLANQTQAAGLVASIGWWNSLVVHDLDQDGDLDFVAGNLGLNAPYRIGEGRPVTLFSGDLDGNGNPDPIIAHYLQGQQVPVPLRNDLLGWVPSLKKKFKDYQSYATANCEAIFEGQKMLQTTVNTFANSWVENIGNGKFALHPLPLEAQTSPIYGILAEDFNGDGAPDLLLTGNSSAGNLPAGQYDAFSGLLLLGDGRGGFSQKSVEQSGFYVPGEGRSLASLSSAGGRRLVFASQNNGALLCFRVK